LKTRIEQYRNLPGQHCGSTAMRSLLRFYCGLDLPEEALFGLGSGIDCMFIESPKLEPSVVVFGRSITMEVDLAQALGVDYLESIETDNVKAWEEVRREVAQGRPTMLCGDVFYLDYRKFKVHFPAHRYVLVGLDDETRTAWVADRLDPEPQPCSYDAVARSRNPPVGLSTLNLWGKFHGTEVRNSLGEACELALRKTADRMLGRDSSQADLIQSVAAGLDLRIATGLQGMADFCREVSGWHDRADRGFIASYLAGSIEKFGTGGGNFRKMFAGFLRWAREEDPGRIEQGLPVLADRAASCWTELAGTLESASQDEGAKDLWKRASEQAGGILEIETELFAAPDRIPGNIGAC